MSRRRTALIGSLAMAALANATACAEGNDDTGRPSSSPASSGQGAAGGGGSGGEGGTGAAGGEGGQGGSAPCDPTSTPNESSCVVTDTQGIFVSEQGDDAAAGTRQAPVRTLTKAMELAQAQDKRVYACAQTFSEALTVPAGIEIYGGLSCETDWSWVEAKPTEITAAADQVPVRLLGGTGTTILQDLRVRASDANAAGGSSIAMIVDGAAAELTRCLLDAGDAQSGVAGQAGPAQASSSALAGEPGIDLSCSTIGGVVGGDPVTNPSCTASVGGDGGESGVNIGFPGVDGLPMPAAGGTGLGGTGQTASAGCTAGTAGQAGDAGTAGVGGIGLGVLASAGHTGVAGGNGTPGQPGQGGGGGGGGKGCLASPFVKPGAGGGSGGTGGCGGEAGLGGGPGGSSIALVILDADVTLIDSILSSATAGNGGAGGAAQPGGPGAAGGLGASPTDPDKGCDGGNGGNGGNGGPGGGGSGGHSLPIAFTGTAPVQQGTVDLKFTAGGTGGPGGGPDNAGSPGLTADFYEF